jgi:hypothetical protein
MDCELKEVLLKNTPVNTYRGNRTKLFLKFSRKEFGFG